MAGIVLSILVVARRERSVGHVDGLGWAVLGLVPGTLLAAFALANLSADGLAVLAAAMILVAVGASLAGAAGRSQRTDAVAGRHVLRASWAPPRR